MGRGLASAVPSTTERLDVVIVDPLAVVRAGLRLLVDDSPDMEVVAHVGTADEGLEALRALHGGRPVVLVSLALEGYRDAFWLIRTLRAAFPGHAIVGVGANAGPETISRTLFVGADGFADKTIEPQEFLDAVRRAASGEVVLATPTSVAVGDIAAGIHRRRQIHVALTEREREVLVVAAEGLTAREIAERLGVRERTITTHLARIYGKLGVGNRLAAIRAATRSGLVTSAVAE
jgi:DNA-binding NarL/FixJ family response regulator